MTPSSTNDSGLRDNHTRGTVADFLRAKMKTGSKLSIVSAYFTIYAYDALKEELERIEHLDFLFGEPSFVNRLDPNKTEKKAFIIDADGLELSNKLQQKRVARECADWIERKVDIKTIRQSNLLHGKMYHVATAGVEDAILGSSNFTVRGLGLGNAGNNIELNLIVDGNRDRQELKQWFAELWGNETLVKDVKQDVLNYLKQLYENNTPEFIYYKTLFHIFEKFLGDAGKTDADLGKTSLFETGVWKALFEFQKDGAKGAINKILCHNGCIIADSVGLGKTYEALAVIKYFELKNERVLVLCPKKLRDNWTVYKANSLLNPFVADRFRYDVVSHTDLSRETGYSGDINLATLNWGNYDLIVIDESHNFRNNTPGKKDEEGNIIRRSRYQRLMEDIIKSGVRTKVLLISATPVNNDLKDLRNQLYFLTENRDDAFAESIGVGSLKETLATAQKVFSTWAKKQTHERKTGELLEKLNAAFFKLLDEITIARSRKHIQKYYKATIAQLGGFPKREKPISIYPEIDLHGRFLSYDKLNDKIAGYKLALFNPSRFVMPEHKADYEKKGAFPFTQGQRETFLIGMMKVNFLRRLESSVKSFEITMERTIAKIEGLEKKIKNFQELPDQNPESEELELELDDPGHDEDLEDAMQVGGKLKFRLDHLRLDGDDGWLKALKRDKDQLRILYNAAQDVTPETDAKLADLKELIAAKVADPTTNKHGEPNRKVLVFTAFADTATYLYESLLPRVQEINQSGRGGSPLVQSAQGQAAPATLFIPFDKDAEVHRTRQNLPHWQQPGRTYFITYRLADSIPESTIREWQNELAVWRQHHPEPWDANARAEYDRFFARNEEWLDAGHGSCLLAQPEARVIVEENFRRFDGERYILDEFVIMPTHVHVIVKPLGDHSLPDILHSWKSFTAKRIIRETGHAAPVWMDESFDHIVRSWDRLEEFRRYIRENPRSGAIKSGRGGSPLVQSAQGQAAPATPLHMALVCGGGDTRTTFGNSAYDQILTNFSPRAKHRAKIPSMPQQGEIDLLIATDCISEGQNLQDCDYLINYDIHWNPVRIIQRFGRIDRIGSANHAVHLVNFWPTEDLNKYINLKNRVEARMALVDLSATFEDNVLKNEEIEDLISDDLRYRDKQLLRLKDEVLDIEDLGDSVSLTEFTLDDFRLELLKYIEANKEALEAAPFGLYTCVPPHPDYKVTGPGVIFCFRQECDVAGAARSLSSTDQGQAAPAINSVNPLHPYFLVYVLEDGNPRFGFANPKQILDIYRILCSGKAEAYGQLCNLFDNETNHGSDMKVYDHLLKKAVDSLATTFRKRAASGLQSGRGFVLPNAQEQVHEKTDLELVTWLVIKEAK